MTRFVYHIINNDKRQVELIYGNKTLKFQLKVKRSFTVLKKLLELYPAEMNIHVLDGVLNDPNRAESDLKNADGFANFIIERRGERQVNYLKLDVKRLFITLRSPPEGKFINLSPRNPRGSLTPELKKGIYAKFGGRCNIMGTKVYDKVNGNKFMKSLMLARYDHRRPVAKDGSSELENWQLLSKLANDEKNKICVACRDPQCEQCALAYPERFNIIHPTRQDISDFRARLNEQKK